MTDLLVTVIQSDLSWEDKAANLAMFEKKILAIEKTEIVVLPEMFSTGFSMQPEKLAETMDGDTVQWMREMAAKKRVILTGSVIVVENGHYFNRLVWMLPNGQYGYYDKRHLFAYAGEHQHYQAGNKRLVASVKGWKLGLFICYDLRFPIWSRQQLKDQEDGNVPTPEYDVLVYVANWPDKRSHAWRTLLTARAIENQCYVIGVNRVGNDGNNIYHSGDSMIIDPLGEVVYHKKDEEDIFTTTLSRQHLEDIRIRFPFWKDADDFSIHL